jgi:actin
MPHAILCLSIAGTDLTESMMQQMSMQPNLRFHSSAEREIVRDIKENLCFVAADYEKTLSEAYSSCNFNKVYELPDGQVLCQIC